MGWRAVLVFRNRLARQDDGFISRRWPVFLPLRPRLSLRPRGSGESIAASPPPASPPSALALFVGAFFDGSCRSRTSFRLGFDFGFGRHEILRLGLGWGANVGDAARRR